MTKKTKEQIKNLDLITRDNKIYTNLEKSLEDSLNIDYLFCMECYYRYSFTHGGSCQVEYQCEDMLDEEELKKLELLKDIDDEIYNYYSSLVSYDREFWKGSKQGYSVKTSFHQYALIEALDEKRFKELCFYGWRNKEAIFLNGYPVSDLQKHLEYGLMKDEDIEKIQDYIQNKNHGWNTIITRNYLALDRTPVNEKYLKINNVLIDVDLNKSKKEILEFVEKIKDDYDSDKKEEHENYSTKKIPNIYDLLGMKKVEDFICDRKDFIKEEDNKKKMFLKYADILFIYDCKKAGFTNGDIALEIELHYDGKGMKFRTIANYYNIAIEYIDNQKYLSFLTGYNN